jgi:peptide/nickel transport system ATP-binding protein
MSPNPPLLRIRDLRTHFPTPEGVFKAVDGVDLQVEAGQVLVLVGESGSGKSMTGFSVLGLIEPPGRIVSGSIQYKGQELIGMPESQLRALRGRDIAMVFQDPMMTLNPVLRIDTQMIEALQAHETMSHAQALARSHDALERVGMTSVAERLKAYPHELSGGMRQRVAIAIALLHRPALLIADEPTTALDVTIQSQIIFEMQKLCAQNGTALVWITHDLGLADAMGDSVCVMYGGRIVESGPVREVLSAPAHPYTRGLMDSLPSRNVRGQRLQQIAGMPPSALNRGQACAFAPRCPQADRACQISPAATALSATRSVRCHHAFTKVSP